MLNRDVVVIGGSAGGFHGLLEILGSLPERFPAAVLVVLHSSPASKDMLSRVLSARIDLRVSTAVDGERLTPGRIYVAPADHHMILTDGHVRTTKGPKENRARPAIDPLFRSAALTRGPRVIGVILSGMLDDGASGLWSIKDRGGLTIIQDPEEAPYPWMPEAAARNVNVDHVVRVAEIGPLLNRLVREPLKDSRDIGPSTGLEIETAIASEAPALQVGSMKLGSLSPWACPECHGVLSQIREGGVLRFRCHTGHAYSADSLLASIAENTEHTLWSAIRSLEEKLLLLLHVSDHLTEQGRPAEAKALRQETGKVQEHIEQLRRIVFNTDGEGGTRRMEA